MTIRRAPLSLLVAILFVPASAYAQSQSIGVTRSIVPDQPFAIFYPETMVPSGGAGAPLLLNHPDAPLQCSMDVVAVEDTSWTADGALAALDDAAVAASWADDFPGFAVASKGTTAYQSGPALIYDGQSSNSPMGVPLTIVHTETVDAGLGYVLDCFFATDAAAQARPIVDFIIANFSTRNDAECCTAEATTP